MSISANRTKVSAVMVTGKSPLRAWMAEKAVVSFLEQDYPDKDMIVITDSALFAQYEFFSHPLIKMVSPTGVKSYTLGALRNLAFDASDADYLIQWDDDDWCHPSRISAQVSALKNKGDSVFLKNQIRYDFATDTAIVYKSGPIHGTVLHPRSVRQRYPDLARAEDTHFMKALPNKVTLDNDPSLYLRFCHGNNTWDDKHIMGRAASPDVAGQRLRFEELPPHSRDYLDYILAKHYKTKRLDDR